MPKATVICYLFSLLFYGLGYLKTLVLKSVDVNSNNFTIYVSLATAYFVITIFFAVIGSFFFYVKTVKYQKIIEITNTEHRVELGRGSDIKRRMSTPEVKVQLSQYNHGLDLERKLSS